MENNNQNQTNKPKYVNGEKYQYNRFEDTFGDAGRYSDETPRNEPFHIFKISDYFAYVFPAAEQEL